MKVAASPRIYMRRCPKFETGGFLVSQTQSLATNPQLLISSQQSLPLPSPCLPLSSCYNKGSKPLIQYHHLKGESARKGALFCLKEGVCYGL